jgi:hypothetical protein
MMGSVMLRTIPSLVLLAAGAASLLYGVIYRTAPVSEEQEIEIDIGGPPMFGPPEDEPFGPPGMPPPGEPFDEPPFAGPPGMMGPPPVLAKVKEKIIVTEEESEPTLIREITFGGITRLASGVLKRTYSGAPPLLCPT